MPGLKMIVQGALALAPALPGAAQPALAAPRVVDVAGVRGASVELVSAARLADGSAIVAGALTPAGRAGARPRVLVVRLRPTGLVDPAFGDGGVLSLQLAREDSRGGSRATAVTVQPASGRAWVGVSIGHGATGAVLALDGRGRRVRGFGERGLLRFKAPASTPTAIAVGGARLVVATGLHPCRGCSVLTLDAASGRRGPQATMAPVPGAGAAGCPGAAISSLALSAAGLLAVGGTGGDSCPARVAVRDAQLAAAGEAISQDARRIAVAAAGPPLDLCVATQREGVAATVRVTLGGHAQLPAPARARAPSGPLRTVVPIGTRACAALVDAGRGAPAQVLEASAGDGAPARVALPRGLRPGTAFRCRRHVLVVGTRRVDGRDRAAVAVVPILRR